MTVIVTHVAFSTIVLPSAAGKPPGGFWSILAAGQVGAIGPFFIMSGLFLYRPFVRRTFLGTPRPGLGSFFVRRAARLLPGFWLLTTFVLLFLNFNLLHGVWDWLRPYALLHIYNAHWYAGLDVAWTVPAEMQFYLVLPLMAWGIHRYARGAADPAAKARRMLWPLSSLVLLQFAWTIFIYLRYDFWPSQYFFPFTVSGLFAIGMAMAVWSVLIDVAPEKKPALYKLAVRRPGLFWLAGAACYAINAAQPFSHPGTADWLNWKAAIIRSFLLLAFSFVFMVPLVAPNATPRWMEVILGNPVMRYLGRISYGLYLWHFSIMYLKFHSGSIFGPKVVPVQMLLGKFGFWELLLPTVVGAIVAASISFWLFERPVLNLAERWVRSWKSSAKPRVAVAGTPQQVGSEDKKAA